MMFTFIVAVRFSLSSGLALRRREISRKKYLRSRAIIRGFPARQTKGFERLWRVPVNSHSPRKALSGCRDNRIKVFCGRDGDDDDDERSHDRASGQSKREADERFRALGCVSKPFRGPRGPSQSRSRSRLT